ncbi:conserved hypothetical protein [Trichinella spiralis]|uniref:hypothetical protein n=1 Tax=Trichinella spiralis TaxID=6334 RepID=UPI0001EFCFC0|nr:conserved hypothetical protein [Trichinella spiralis]
MIQPLLCIVAGQAGQFSSASFQKYVIILKPLLANRRCATESRKPFSEPPVTTNGHFSCGTNDNTTSQICADQCPLVLDSLTITHCRIARASRVTLHQFNHCQLRLIQKHQFTNLILLNKNGSHADDDNDYR